MSANLTYLRYEILRTVRNRRFFVFALLFPVVLYFLIAAPNRNQNDLSGTGISAPLYFMVSLISFGTMTAMLSSGGRIANERAAGWTRQLRISPLSARSYFRTKLATGYLMALLTILILYVCGLSLGVSMPAQDWLEVTGLILVALAPFAALGIVLGHLLNPDSVGPVIGGSTALLAFLGGTWFPIPDSGFFHDVGTLLPSYWLVQASRIAVGGAGWGDTGWLVIAAWSVVLTVLAIQVYRRDTGRV
jgi:ABC-2 type transport system permease protein